MLSTHKHQSGNPLMSAEPQVNRSLSSSVSSSARQKCIFRVSNAQNFRACAVRAMTVLSGYTETANTSAAYCIECIVLCSTEGWPAAVLCIIRIILYYVLIQYKIIQGSQTPTRGGNIGASPAGWRAWQGQAAYYAIIRIILYY